MVGITTVGSIFTSVKTAIDIAKLIKDSGVSLEKAEVKLQLAELIGALANVKIELKSWKEPQITNKIQSTLKILNTVTLPLLKKFKLFSAK